MAFFGEFFGGKPKVPEFVPVDVQKEQQKSIGGNLDALGDLKKLGADVNTFSREEIDKMYESAFGGYYSRIKDQVGKNTLDFLSGEIPTDVSNAVRTNAASRSLYGGYGGSGMARNLEARDLGLTSLDLMTKGLDSATRWMASTKSPTFDVTSMFVQPQFQAQFAAEERNSKFQRDYLKNQWDWYGSFGQQMVRFEDTLAETAAAVAGAMI